MKKTFLLVALVLGSASITFAQVQKSEASKNNATAVKKTGAEDRINQKIQKLTAALDLTPQQQTSVKHIIEQNMSDMQAAKQAKDRTKAKQLRDGMEQQIVALLTPQQKVKFQGMMDERKTGARTQKNTQTKTN